MNSLIADVGIFENEFSFKKNTVQKTLKSRNSNNSLTVKFSSKPSVLEAEETPLLVFAPSERFEVIEFHKAFPAAFNDKRYSEMLIQLKQILAAMESKKDVGVRIDPLPYARFSPSNKMVEDFRISYNGRGFSGIISRLSGAALDFQRAEKLLKNIVCDALEGFSNYLQREHSSKNYFIIEDRFLLILQSAISIRLGNVPMAKRGNLAKKIVDEIIKFTGKNRLRFGEFDIFSENQKLIFKSTEMPSQLLAA